jgi:hypothetical protein
MTKKLALCRETWQGEKIMRWTEKQIEGYLTDETRELTGSDGAPVSVTMFRTYWITYDAARVDDVYTEAELVDWAHQRVEKEGYSFVDVFRSNIGHLDHEFRRQNSDPGCPSP